jgi:hypothetical protein
MKCEGSGSCRLEASAVVRLENGKRDHLMCGEHATAAGNVAEALGARYTITPIVKYEPPTVKALGTVEDLVADRKEAIAIFQDIMKHGEHVVGGILPA